METQYCLRVMLPNGKNFIKDERYSTFDKAYDAGNKLMREHDNSIAINVVKCRGEERMIVGCIF